MSAVAGSSFTFIASVWTPAAGAAACFAWHVAADAAGWDAAGDASVAVLATAGLAWDSGKGAAFSIGKRLGERVKESAICMKISKDGAKDVLIQVQSSQSLV